MPDNVDALLKLGDVAAAGANVSEAYKYYSQVLEIDPGSVRGWLGKGKAAGQSSSLDKPRLKEMESCMTEAIKAAPAEDRSAVWTEGAASMAQVCAVLFQLNIKRFNQFGAIVLPEMFGLGILKKAKPVPEHLDRFRNLTMAILLTLQNTIVQGDELRTSSPELFRTFLDIAQHFYFTLAIVKPEADMGYREVAWGFPPADRKYVDALVHEYLPRAQAVDQTIPDPRDQAKEKQEAANKASGCFIATAVLDQNDDPDLLTLWRFRDRFLCRTRLGRATIVTYYRHASVAADWIVRRPLVRSVCRVLVVRPAAATAKCILFVHEHLARLSARYSRTAERRRDK